MYRISVYDAPDLATEGVLNHIHKFVYHGSISGKFDTIKPLSLDYGNAFQSPGWSIYTFTKKDYCVGWCVICYVFLWEKKYGIKCSGSSYGNKTMLTESEYDTLVKLIEKLPKYERVFYIYTIKIEPEYTLGFGHSSNTKECITIRNEVKPQQVDTMYLTKEILDEHVIIVQDNISVKERMKLAGQNGRLLTPFMTHDMIFNGEMRKKVKKAVRDGELHPGDTEELLQWMKDNNYKFHNVSLRERLLLDL